jgi:hypothetical protein
MATCSKIYRPHCLQSIAEGGSVKEERGRLKPKVSLGDEEGTDLERR